MAADVKRIRLNCLTVAVGTAEEPLGRDLQRLKGRSRGARLRQLALLGLAMENQGFRLGGDGQVRWPATVLGGGAVIAPSPALPERVEESGPLASLEPDHKLAMNDLVASLGGFDL